MKTVHTLLNGKLALAAACVAGLLGTSGAQAAAVTYDSRSAWSAAVLSPSTVTFDGFTGDKIMLQEHGYSEGGVAFNSDNGAIFGIGPLASSALSGERFAAGAFYGTGYLEWLSGAVLDILTITLPGAVHAIGFDLAELQGALDTFTIIVGSETFTVDTSTSGARFFGITDMDAFTSFTITSPRFNDDNVNVHPTIDNLSFAGDLVAAVPEPASLLMFATGAGALIARRRQKKRV